MRHARLIFAVTALAVFVPIAFARVPYAAKSDRPRHAARVVAVTAEIPSTAWVDPPLGLRGAEPAALMSSSEAILAHRPTMPLPLGARTQPRLPGTLEPPATPQRRVDADPIGDLIRGLDRRS